MTSTTFVPESGAAARTGGLPVPVATVAAGRRRRWPMIVAAVLGAALVTMPLAFGMFSKTPKGAVMLSEFHPFMTTARLDGFQTDIRQIDAAVKENKTSITQQFASAGVTRADLDTRFPSLASLDAQWPTINSDMTDLLNKVQGNLGNYQAIDALPSFRLFPWFFAVPGVLILGSAVVALRRLRLWRPGRWAIAIVGIGLVIAPAAFQMFQRAPDGGRMMSSFKTIETTGSVVKIQDYFATMASGQGDLRLGVVPALEEGGLSGSQVAERFPAVTTLDRNWVRILNDLTPMIGAMSDNVPNYRAIASLPPFPLFPWFFVMPGLLAIGASLLARDRTEQSNNQQQGES